MATRQVLRRALTRGAVRTPQRWGSGGPMQPPFARTPPPNRKIIVNHDLVWEDGVVAETILDFDAPHVSVGKAALMWLGGFGFFASIYAAVTLWDPESHRQAVPREATLPPTAFNPVEFWATGKHGYDSEEEEAEAIVQDGGGHGHH